MLLALLIASAVVISGCSGDDTDGRPGDSTSQDTPAIDTTTTGPPQLERRDAGFALPVTLVAGDARFEVSKVEFSNATPGTYFDDEPDLLADDLLYVSFTTQIEPAAGGTGSEREWPPKSFQIVTGSGRVVSGSAVDYAPAIVAGSEPASAAVVFPVDDDEMTGARFRFDDGTNPLAEVTLTVPAPTDGTAPTSPPG